MAREKGGGAGKVRITTTRPTIILGSCIRRSQQDSADKHERNTDIHAFLPTKIFTDEEDIDGPGKATNFVYDIDGTEKAR